MSETTENKKTAKKGPIRTEALVPFFAIVIIFGVYFKFFFDKNIQWAIEAIGYQVVGAEVDVKKVETSFTKGTFRIQGIEITNPDRPTHNLVELGDIRFGVLWDALLRAKFVVQEMAVENIEIGSKREKPGKVKPPPPPEPVAAPSNNEKNSGGTQIEKVEKAAVKAVENRYKNNVLSDIAGIMGGGSAQMEAKDIEKNLSSKKRLATFEKELNEKSKKWDERIKSLPQGKEIEALGQRLSKVKTSNFKNPMELVESLKEIDGIMKEADAKYKVINSTANDLNAELNKVNSDFKEIDNLVKKDIADLQAHFKIPSIDAKSLTMGLLQQYMAPYLSQIDHYRSMAAKYVPPNIIKKIPGGEKGSHNADSSEPDLEIQPRPRAKGVSYEFGRQNSYPLFWIQRVSISSQAGASPASGNIKGEVTDVTSNQLLTGKPTLIKIAGNFPGLDVHDFLTKISVDNRKRDSLIDFDIDIGHYGIEGRDVVTSPDAKIAFKKAVGGIKTKGELIGLRNLNLKFDNQISKIDYEISASNPEIDTILKDIFSGIPIVTIDAKISGMLPDTATEINSNIGPELQKGFEKQINKKIDEAKAKLNLAIEQSIGKERARVESEMNRMREQVNGEVKKINDQINKEKTKIDKQANATKKDGEKQGQQKLQQDGQKAIDEMKKRLGL